MGTSDSEIILAVFSEAYEKSINCRAELDYAKHLSKIIIPVHGGRKNWAPMVKDLKKEIKEKRKKKRKKRRGSRLYSVDIFKLPKEALVLRTIRSVVKKYYRKNKDLLCYTSAFVVIVRCSFVRCQQTRQIQNKENTLISRNLNTSPQPKLQS